MKKLVQLRGHFRNSLQAQAVAANFLPVAAASICVLAFFSGLFLLQLQAFQNELQLRAQSLADSLSRQTELAAMLGDREELERLARTVVVVESVLYVMVEADSGEPLVKVTRQSFPAADIPQRSATNSDCLHAFGRSHGQNFVDVTAKIRPAGPHRPLDWEDAPAPHTPLGSIRVGVSTETYRTLCQRSLWGVIALSIISLALTLGVQYRQMRRILSPLTSLIAFTRQVADGDLAQRAVVVRHDEVGQLAIACNEMVCGLEKSRLDLLEALNAAQEASRLKSQFLANMSHEIRTPLHGVIGMTELALDAKLSPEPREQLTTALSSAHALLGVLNDILDVSKIEAGKLELDSIPFNLEAEVEHAAKLLALQAHRKGLELVCDMHPDVPRWVCGDPDRVRQVLTNLISNAIKFTSSGEVQVAVSLVSEIEDRVCLGFAISDTGIGIPPDKQATVFEPFAQADGSMTRQYGGTGLGLTICVRLVEMMNGEINVKSQVGIGTTFRFTAIFGRACEPAPGMRSSEPAILEGLRTLVVDDNETNRRILSTMLDKWRMEVVCVDSGSEALQSLHAAHTEGRPFRLVILDAMMPEMDGFETARQIKRMSNGEPLTVMMLSSGGADAHSAGYHSLGITHCVTKPIGRSALLDVILRALGQDLTTSADKEADTTVDHLGRRTLSILVVDDSVVNRKILDAVLRKAGHSVELASDGQEALSAFNRRPFDVILMDVQMPNMDGWEATGTIRELEIGTGDHVPIIALTAHAIKGDRERCISAGMDDYVTKPVSRVKLFEAIEAVTSVHRVAAGPH